MSGNRHLQPLRYSIAAATLVALAVTPAFGQTTTYPVVDTGQSRCYNNASEITSPEPGAAFYGQDAQYRGTQPKYTLSSDGLTVYDNNTGLTWQRSADTDGDGDIDASDKLTWTKAQAHPAVLNAQRYGGHNDWRLPTIKELYSLIDFRGTDPSGYSGTDTSGLVPYLDTGYFEFAYGDTSAGERIIDAQYASSTLYVSTTGRGDQTLFGVNFADGRIKGYGLSLFGTDKTFFVICCRGNTSYGVNRFTDNGDGTVTDAATGLTWQKADSGSGKNWEDALAYAEDLELGGHEDWRLPNAKELQSIVDYTRSPSTTSSAAIAPVFNCTTITNEAGAADYASYWTGTTHVNWTSSPGAAGIYICFGRAMGYMNSSWIDVHGAGAQRSDPKAGDPDDYPTGRGPQGDAIRIYNFVRCVRDVGNPDGGDSGGDPGDDEPGDVLADLVVESVVANPASVQAGEDSIISAVIKNAGDAPAPESQVAMTVDGKEMVVVDIEALAAGASIGINFPYTDVAASPTTHTVQVVADSGGSTTESDESNNTGAATVTIAGKPDLVVKDGSLTATPNPVPAGGPATIRFQVRNQGDSAASGSIEIALYLDGQLVRRVGVSCVAPGEDTGPLAFRIGRVTDTSSGHAIRVVVDSTDTVAESDESNNEATLSLQSVAQVRTPPLRPQPRRRAPRLPRLRR